MTGRPVTSIRVHREIKDGNPTVSAMTTMHRPRPTQTLPDAGALRVLVVDDEPSIGELLSLALRYEGWDVCTSATGTAAVEVARTFGPDAVLLDRMLPDMDGIDVLRQLRADRPGLPVIFVTARDGEHERIAGLTAGGDDYVTKPFSLEEIAVRLGRLVRRANRRADDVGRLVVGDLTLDEDRHQVVRGGEEIDLSATEFELLRHLMRNPGRVLSRDEILDWVWQYDFGGNESVVELYVSYLRRKLDAGRAPMIHTVRGAGYVLEPASA
jgi:two-component system, OmpR family, response regulator